MDEIEVMHTNPDVDHWPIIGEPDPISDTVFYVPNIHFRLLRRLIARLEPCENAEKYVKSEHDADAAQLWANCPRISWIEFVINRLNGQHGFPTADDWWAVVRSAWAVFYSEYDHTPFCSPRHRGMTEEMLHYLKGRIVFF